VHFLRVLIEVHHLVLYPRREILHVDPRPREVLAPQAQSSVLRRRGQHRAGGVPGYPPHIRFRGAFDGLRGHVFQGTVLLTVKLVNLPMRGINEWSMSLSGVATFSNFVALTLKVGSLLAVAMRWYDLPIAGAHAISCTVLLCSPSSHSWVAIFVRVNKTLCYSFRRV
jgi:hypothetical protein